SVVMDNASNNDTLMEHIAIKCSVADIAFDPVEARIRCMPHTAHLAAIKLLEAIGAISKSSRKKAEGRQTAYQDAVTAPLGRQYDDDFAGDDEDGDDEGEDSDVRGVVRLQSVEKARSENSLNLITTQLRPSFGRSFVRFVPVLSAVRNGFG
ncbi:hypothetical protein K438DRAFT_1573231, partial [Mycena galopus ATCC 62051]